MLTLNEVKWKHLDQPGARRRPFAVDAAQGDVNG